MEAGCTLSISMAMAPHACGARCMGTRSLETIATSPSGLPPTVTWCAPLSIPPLCGSWTAAVR